ncbi:MAG: hypothetical protein ACLVJO_01715 [[Clostridium] scindens]
MGRGKSSSTSTKIRVSTICGTGMEDYFGGSWVASQEGEDGGAY